MIDIIIINALKKGNQSAYKILYERTIAYVYSIVRRFVDVEHVHKDIIQDVYAKIYININQFDSDKGTFKFWMRRIVVNQCFEYFRREKGLAAHWKYKNKNSEGEMHRLFLLII